MRCSICFSVESGGVSWFFFPRYDEKSEVRKFPACPLRTIHHSKPSFLISLFTPGAVNPPRQGKAFLCFVISTYFEVQAGKFLAGEKKETKHLVSAAGEGLVGPGGVLQEESAFSGVHWIQPRLLWGRQTLFFQHFPLKEDGERKKLLLTSSLHFIFEFWAIKGQNRMKQGYSVQL